MTQNQTVQPQISQHLLTELPYFFGGFRASIRELLQNSIRAGATQIQFQTDEQGFSVTDNGCGLEDPQMLLTAARSGWGEHVTDPAGIGALSLLNPEWSRSVTFRSKDWQFTLTPEQFIRGDLITVLRSDQPVQGFEIAVQLRIPQNLKQTLKELEIDTSENDLCVTLNGESTGQVSPVRGIRIETEAGEVVFTRDTYRTNIDWEKLSVPANALENLLKKDPLIAALLSYFWGLRLYPKSGSGIRPKLPDRESVIHNEALETAATQITAALRERLLQDAREWAADRTDISYSSIKAVQQSNNFKLLNSEVLYLALQELGYRRVRAANPNAEIITDDDGDRYSNLPAESSCDLTRRAAQRCSNEHWLTQEALLREYSDLPLLSMDGEGEEWAPVIIANNNQEIPTDSGYGLQIILSRDLRLDGHSVPFAVCETTGTVYLRWPEDGSDIPKTVLNAAGTLLLQWIILGDETGEYEPLDSYFELYEPDTKIEGQDLGHLLHEQLRAVLKADEILYEQKLNHLKKEVNRLRGLEQQIQATARELGAEKEAQPLIKRLTDKRQLAEKRVQDLEQETP